MKVYEIRYDVRNYRVLYNNGDNLDWVFKMTGLPLLKDWTPPGVHIALPQHPDPDFWMAVTELAFDPKIMDDSIDVAMHLEMAGEWLPIDVEDGPKLVVLNVLNVVNAIDIHKTRWTEGDMGKHKYIDQSPGSMVFHPDRLPEPSIFKIPQNSCSTIYCVERSGDPLEDFKAAVEAEGLKGLLFNLVWEG